MNLAWEINLTLWVATKLMEGFVNLSNSKELYDLSLSIFTYFIMISPDPYYKNKQTPMKQVKYVPFFSFTNRKTEVPRNWVDRVSLNRLYSTSPRLTQIILHQYSFHYIIIACLHLFQEQAKVNQYGEIKEGSYQ